MRFVERFVRMVKADAHGVVDSLEDRSLLLKQHLREAELALAGRRAQQEALADEAKCIAQERERLAAEIAALDEDVELALESEKDDLARFAVRQLLPKRRALAECDERVGELEARGRVLAEALPEQERELEALRSRVRVQIAAARERVPVAPFDAPGVADEEVEIELLRRRENARGVR